MVKIKNTSSEPVAFTGLPVIKPGETIDVSQSDAEYLCQNESMKMVEEPKSSKRDKPSSFKGTEAE